jgi:hypothetical protein
LSPSGSWLLGPPTSPPPWYLSKSKKPRTCLLPLPLVGDFLRTSWSRRFSEIYQTPGPSSHSIDVSSHLSFLSLKQSPHGTYQCRRRSCSVCSVFKYIILHLPTLSRICHFSAHLYTPLWESVALPHWLDISFSQNLVNLHICSFLVKCSLPDDLLPLQMA